VSAVGVAKILAPALGAATVAVATMLLRDRLAPHPKAPTLEEVQAAIDLGNGRYVDALCHADADGYANLFLPDGLSLPSHGPILHGREVIRDNIAATFQTMRYVGGDMQTIETLLADDAAYEIGRYEFQTERRGRHKPEVMRGRYLVVWQPYGDEWKIAVDVDQAGAPVF
jgi:uncharacterized protein (TIGR02246 family)